MERTKKNVPASQSRRDRENPPPTRGGGYGMIGRRENGQERRGWRWRGGGKRGGGEERVRSGGKDRRGRRGK